MQFSQQVKSQRCDLGASSGVDLGAVSWQIGSAFLAGTLLEVASHPKPGLVTARSNGSHSDMDIKTFMVASAAIAPCFYQCAEVGTRHQGSARELLRPVREIGCRYEGLLLAATGGVNTQRGFLFSAGVLSAAAGRLARDRMSCDVDRLFSTAAAMTDGLCARELGNGGDREAVTAGEWLYQRYGVLGIRGEVEAGFPTVVEAGLPALRSARSKGASLEDALVHTLISLMAVCEDTTLLWRGGFEALDFVRSKAREALQAGGALTPAGMSAIHQLDAECITRNLSPGGSADLLAVTYGVDVLVSGAPGAGTAFAGQPCKAGQSPQPPRIS
ncbi:triphosphoribosyl-dephospho-CoA synthase/triphosphoribosyl-dephospho-CoA synthase [Breoghania corrubedonensis]|uniref:Probable 2-(5''-triphosphoribosyl)-3'-dephosphocoenzyme-A synthase n=1 Tax=Breoghania corrubedonensis TaxID=665038 RepID=A0A2T5V9K0_9HYPH|nr:triphosphoribosyl-dephospho-CoA synthase MdcB [Breoghania corrubedonensis]PTW60414.1 triphosphoribosyl-dephospho-CoA synthase/triphosphoribosyl-dephospho-CoA synthase [Breoghania corrubedonensis]